MRLSIKFLEGLSNHHCKRFNPSKMGRLPPVRFMSESDIDTAEQEGKNQVKISITDHVSKSFELFVEGGPEAVIQLIRSRESIVKDRKLCNI